MNLPMFVRSMKQNRYSMNAVGTIYKSILSLSLASATLSNSTTGRPSLANKSEEFRWVRSPDMVLLIRSSMSSFCYVVRSLQMIEVMSLMRDSF